MRWKSSWPPVGANGRWPSSSRSSAWRRHRSEAHAGQVEATEQIGRASLPVGAGLGIELVHEVDHVEEAAALAASDAGARDADGEVRLACSGAADQDDVALMLKELSAGEIAHERLVDRSVREAELVDLLCERRLGDGHLVFDRARLLLADLGVQEVADDPLGFVLALHGRGDDLVIRRLHSVELEPAHHVQHLRSFHGPVS
jgi:hypothetical protein